MMLNTRSAAFKPVTVNAWTAQVFAATATGDRVDVTSLNSSHVCPALTLKLFKAAFDMAGLDIVGPVSVTMFAPVPVTPVRD